jgi:hypothetical protein
MPKLDDMKWHLGGGEFPLDLPEENAATHIGFFVAWVINSGLWGASQSDDDSHAVQRVRDRTITGRTFLIERCDGKLFPGMLNKEGAAFAQKYYEREYFKDYRRTLVVDLKSDYLVEDSWDNYDRISEVIDTCFGQKHEKPWWRLW